MDVTLLGTGAPAGLPRPGCPCAACALARGEEARAATAVLVDGAVLLDVTPGVALAAARAGHSLVGVRHLLLSHPHDGPPDGPGPGLPEPGRASEDRELTLLTGHRVRAVAVDAPGTGYEVLGHDGARLLYLPPAAAPSGPVTAPVPYDLVLADVAGRPDALARLRAAKAVGAGTDVVAVHVDHDVPPGPELRRRLAAAGARVVADGTRLTAGSTVPADGGTGEGPPDLPGVTAAGHLPELPAVPRRTLVLGGARSGKSAEAERRLTAFPDVLYVATGGGRGDDPEWAARVRAHRERRPDSWGTVETCDLVPLLAGEGPTREDAAGRDSASGGCALLVDCLSLWLAAMMDEVGAWDDDAWAAGGQQELHRRVAALTDAVRGTRRTLVAVSNEVGSGIVPATASGRRYRDELGRLNAAFAAECEHVLLVVAGQAVVLRE